MTLVERKIVEKHGLSNGDTVLVTKLHRKYNFVRLFIEDQAPEMVLDINLKSAMSLLTDAIQQDVCESD